MKDDSHKRQCQDCGRFHSTLTPCERVDHFLPGVPKAPPAVAQDAHAEQIWDILDDKGEAPYNCPPPCPKCGACHRGECPRDNLEGQPSSEAERAANYREVEAKFQSGKLQPLVPQERPTQSFTAPAFYINEEWRALAREPLETVCDGVATLRKTRIDADDELVRVLRQEDYLKLERELAEANEDLKRAFKSWADDRVRMKSQAEEIERLKKRGDHWQAVADTAENDRERLRTHLKNIRKIYGPKWKAIVAKGAATWEGVCSLASNEADKALSVSSSSTKGQKQ